eukprot:TRINITY_DN5738_c0_g1_i2.p1 TRINITY_DN5738_c0_g1~~TRINITY_DN5738_c0_g1_i2.p1  ORF type:complete len:568 (-),score=164.03 TRINITY_DN5738_c0_g1_i2:105-1808(-)
MDEEEVFHTAREGGSGEQNAEDGDVEDGYRTPDDGEEGSLLGTLLEEQMDSQTRLSQEHADGQARLSQDLPSGTPASQEVLGSQNDDTLNLLLDLKGMDGRLRDDRKTVVDPEVPEEDPPLPPPNEDPPEEEADGVLSDDIDGEELEDGELGDHIDGEHIAEDEVAELLNAELAEEEEEEEITEYDEEIDDDLDPAQNTGVISTGTSRSSSSSSNARLVEVASKDKEGFAVLQSASSWLIHAIFEHFLPKNSRRKQVAVSLLEKYKGAEVKLIETALRKYVSVEQAFGGTGRAPAAAQQEAALEGFLDGISESLMQNKSHRKRLCQPAAAKKRQDPVGCFMEQLLELMGLARSKKEEQIRLEERRKRAATSEQEDVSAKRRCHGQVEGATKGSSAIAMSAAASSPAQASAVAAEAPKTTQAGAPVAAAERATAAAAAIETSPAKAKRIRSAATATSSVATRSFAEQAEQAAKAAVAAVAAAPKSLNAAAQKACALMPESAEVTPQQEIELRSAFALKYQLLLTPYARTLETIDATSVPRQESQEAAPAEVSMMPTGVEESQGLQFFE